MPHLFEQLKPEIVLDAVESQGYVCDGRLLPLNSYENRVYQVGIEEAQPLIAKFYRPQRWSDEQILEEHRFCFELVEHELPVVAPLCNDAGDSLFAHADTDTRFRFSLYPRKGGHAPELDNPDNLVILGRLLARMHQVGAAGRFEHRPAIDSRGFGHDSVAFVREHFIPSSLKAAYEAITADLLQSIDAAMRSASGIESIRVHGDCHIGNMLWRDDYPHFVDFDDARTAPAVQDIWMLLSGDRLEQTRQLAEIMDGYGEFADFDTRELLIVEALRSLRILHYSAWLARRWDDPAFPMSFPWFNTQRYWEDHILTLREQRAAMDEAPLRLS